MAVSLEDCLVIGISSRALFDLDDENYIYETKGLQAYSEYQLAHEQEILKPGSGFALVKALLKLNESSKKRRVEVLIMSRNSADTSLRIFTSIAHYGLDITRAVLSGGGPLTVRSALAAGFAAGRIYTNAIEGYDPLQDIAQIRIAFDGDAVLFSDASEQIFQKDGLEAFAEHEKACARQVLPEGPFAQFLKTIAALQKEFEGHAPIRTALVTARNAPAHERVIRTLRAWDVRIDEAFFLGGITKREVLKAFGAHIFFDDQSSHTTPASSVVPSAQVVYGDGK